VLSESGGAVPASVVSLAAARLARATEGHGPLPVSIEPCRNAVLAVFGAGDDEVELGLTPEQAEQVGRALVAAAREARRG
jgi:hypothetical protein